MHLSQSELSELINQAARQVTVGATYRHYKGDEYKVLQLGFLEAADEVCVIYKAQYGDRHIFVRPLASWLETTEWQGKTVKRFEAVH